MFTGIVEEIGIVRNITRGANGASLVVECGTILEDIKIGDSICINGVCETVVSFDSKSLRCKLVMKLCLLLIFPKSGTGIS